MRCHTRDELEYSICRAAILAGRQPIELVHVQEACAYKAKFPSAKGQYRPEPLTDLVKRAQAGGITNLRALAHEQLERSLFERVFCLSKGNQSKMAALMGATRSTIRGGLRELGLLKPGSADDSPQHLSIHPDH